MNYYNVEDTYYCVVVMDTIPEADENPENMQKVHVAVAEYTRQRYHIKRSFTIWTGAKWLCH